MFLKVRDVNGKSDVFINLSRVDTFHQMSPTIDTEHAGLIVLYIGGEISILDKDSSDLFLKVFDKAISPGFCEVPLHWL